VRRAGTPVARGSAEGNLRATRPSLQLVQEARVLVAAALRPGGGRAQGGSRETRGSSRPPDRPTGPARDSADGGDVGTEALFGSVAEAVLRQAHVPVLILRATAAGEGTKAA
jgi:hypothetical protein